MSHAHTEAHTHACPCPCSFSPSPTHPALTASLPRRDAPQPYRPHSAVAALPGALFSTAGDSTEKSGREGKRGEKRGEKRGGGGKRGKKWGGGDGRRAHQIHIIKDSGSEALETREEKRERGWKAMG